MSDEHQILEQRARTLARPRSTLAERSTLAVFERAGVRYAIDPRFVYEVARAPRPTALPRSERHWLGVTSLHGELIAVADLPVLLGDDAATHAEESTLLLVLGVEARELAIEVDAVLEPVRADVPRHEPPHTDAASSLIEGVTEDGLRVVRGERLLSDPRLTVNSSLET
ncbi:MAG TPA: chemotaxis protein CheW [Polyangiales bacterium]|nr:chemotaxis protein CheW [Polyangiales bacterium]